MVPQSGFEASLDSDPRHGADIMEGGRTALDNKTSLLNTPSPRSFAGPRFREYNPYNYTDSIGTLEARYESLAEQPRDGEAFMFCPHFVLCQGLKYFCLFCRTPTRMR